MENLNALVTKFSQWSKTETKKKSYFGSIFCSFHLLSFSYSDNDQNKNHSVGVQFDTRERKISIELSIDFNDGGGRENALKMVSYLRKDSPRTFVSFI